MNLPDATKKIAKNISYLITRKRSIYQILNYLKYLSYFKGVLSEIVTYKPINLYFMASFECSLECRMCLTHSPTIPLNPYKYRGSPKLSYELFKKAITKFHEALNCAFIGNGEPLLNNDIFKMINYVAKVKKIHTTLCTNGTLLDNYLQEVINSSLNFISISINAHNAETFTRITGLSSHIFHKIILNVKDLVNLRNSQHKQLRIALSMIIDRESVQYVQEMINFASSLGVDGIMIYNIIPYPFTYENARKQSVFIDDDHLIKYLKEIKLPDNHINIGLPALLDSKCNHRLCRDFYSSISVDGNGNVSGCDRLMLNSENNGKFWDKDVFNNNHFRALRRMFIDSHENLEAPCQVCYNNTPCKITI